MILGSVEFGYEYCGVPSPFIKTPATDRVCLTILHASKSGCGTMLLGNKLYNH